MTCYARLAQLVEHSHGKAGVEGSSPSPGFFNQSDDPSGPGLPTRPKDRRRLPAHRRREPHVDAPLEALSEVSIDLLHHTQPVTVADIKAGRIRIPIGPTKQLLRADRGDVEVELRGTRMTCRYDPRLGPDRERSGVLLVGKAVLSSLVRPTEVLWIARKEEVVRLS